MIDHSSTMKIIKKTIQHATLNKLSIRKISELDKIGFNVNEEVFMKK
jgi:hypothetical protein